MRAKDWAVQQGLAKAGRGRMSLEAHEAIRNAIANGMTFDDYTVTEKPVKTLAGDTKTVMVKADSKTDTVTDYRDGFYRFPRDQKWEIRLESGKRVVIGGATGCLNCKYSLVGHTCDSPLVLGPDLGQYVPVPVGE